ncbi:unnamed protein product [Orchesella dallaii]|uniref:C2HC/C3H-type domain-containing protein n=1 Tax=Orchesella dallaii TaxID=48710 RepID=A0ABP1Q6A5_9HEXA
MSQIPKGSGSRLAQMQAQFQQKQMQEKEAKLLQMLDSQQQKAMQKAALNGVLPSNKYTTNINNNNNNNLLMNGNVPVANVGAGKVRQMFEERRRGGGVNGSMSGGSTNGYGSRNGLAGIDKSHPLEPLVVTNNNKSRSSSSKSDPANYVSTNSSSRTTPNGMRNTHVPPMMKPPNLGTSNRTTSLTRERSGSREPPTPNQNEPSSNPKTSSVSSANSTSSSGGKPYHQRQQHKSSASHPPPPPQNAEESYLDYITPLPSTTKYSDYAQELEKRENALATKLKKTTISSSPDDYASRSGGGSPTHKSASPTQRSVTGSGANSPSRPNSKSPTTMSTPGARSVGRTSSVSSKAASVKKTSGVIKSKPSAPPRSTAGPPPGLDECKVCGRYFAPDRIQKHESICKKTTTKKRKVFDPTKMRMLGTEAEPYIRVVSAKPNKPAPAAATAKKVDWRKKHEDFIKTIRAAKEYQAHIAKGGDPKDLPPPPPTDTSDYVQCPFCNRKFSEGAAERHIPKCKNIKSNKNKAKR